MAPGQIRAFGTGGDSRLRSILNQAHLAPSASSPVSAVGVLGPIELDRNACILANEALDFPDAIYMGPSSLLVIPAELAEDPLGVISSVRFYPGPRAHVLFDDSAKLYVSNARIGRRYTLFAPQVIACDTYGGALDIARLVISDSPLLVPVWNGNSINGNVLAFRPGFVDEIYPRTSPAQQAFILAALEKDLIGPAHISDSAGGVRLLSRAIDRRFLGNDPDAVARTLQSVQDMIQAAGVASMAWQAHGLLQETMEYRASFRSEPFTPARSGAPGSAGGEAADTPAAGMPAGDTASASMGNVALWLRPLYRRWSYSGVESLNVSFNHDLDASLGGLALGVDYTIPGLVRAGLCAGMGSGHATSGEEYNATENSMNYHALGAWLALTWGDWLLAGEYAHVDARHNITQELDKRLAMEDLAATMHTKSSGYRLRLERRTVFDWFTAVEYLALGETWLDTDAHTVKSGNMRVLHGKAVQQQIGTFTAGLAVEHQFDFTSETCGLWWLKPVVEYSITQSYGDLESLTPVALEGFAVMEQQAYSQITVSDPVTYRLGLGLYAGGTNASVGLTYSHMASAHGSGDSVQCRFVWTF